MTHGAEKKQKTVRRISGRVMLIMAFFVLIASSLVARAIQLQVLDKDFLNQQADTRHLHKESISAHRGNILDRNGGPLAISTPVDSIWVNPKEFANSVEKIPQIAKALDVDSEILMLRITRNMNKEFLYLKRHLTPDLALNVMALK